MEWSYKNKENSFLNTNNPKTSNKLLPDSTFIFDQLQILSFWLLSHRQGFKWYTPSLILAVRIAN